MAEARLTISECQLTEKGTLEITKLEIIDNESGETLRIARITPELVEFLKSIEINIDFWTRIQNMKDKNPAFRVLIDSFNLYT